MAFELKIYAIFVLLFKNSCEALIKGFQEEVQEDVNFHKVLLDFIQKNKVTKVLSHDKEEEDSEENGTLLNSTSSSTATMESQDEQKEGMTVLKRFLLRFWDGVVCLFVASRP